MFPETQRVYPVNGFANGTTIAAQLIGFVDDDGEGQYGIEAARTGCWPACGARSPPRRTSLAADRGLGVPALEPTDGSDLRLTLDAGIQHLLEQAIWTNFRNNAAAGATGLIMNAETGAILGMARFPSYDANQFATTDGEPSRIRRSRGSTSRDRS